MSLRRLGVAISMRSGSCHRRVCAGRAQPALCDLKFRCELTRVSLTHYHDEPYLGVTSPSRRTSVVGRPIPMVWERTSSANIDRSLARIPRRPRPAAGRRVSSVPGRAGRARSL
ncbi:hypothetical protein EVAR_50253_1 [Eumeta japonica]|uniref:Uncharacterized protein n=1 Tax=Eumeta variegata TaxID=151549 RepID=A0A4C1YHK5_EUMVA|nr:hypothetical protein EVAR_50253_1 [Eumeta japonica]